VSDPYLFRMGTSGGIGLEPGTVVVSTAVVDGMLREVSETVSIVLLRYYLVSPNLSSPTTFRPI